MYLNLSRLRVGAVRGIEGSGVDKAGEFLEQVQGWVQELRI